MGVVYVITPENAGVIPVFLSLESLNIVAAIIGRKKADVASEEDIALFGDDKPNEIVHVAVSEGWKVISMPMAECDKAKVVAVMDMNEVPDEDLKLLGLIEDEEPSAEVTEALATMNEALTALDDAGLEWCAEGDPDAEAEVSDDITKALEVIQATAETIEAAGYTLEDVPEEADTEEVAAAEDTEGQSDEAG